MLEDIADDAKDVVAVLTTRIEGQFGMGVDELRTAVSDASTANPRATGIIKWYGLLGESQAAVDRAEEALLAALETQPSEVDDAVLGLAHRVNAAVATRDGRALIVGLLLDPDAQQTTLAAERLARMHRGGRQGPAVQTSPPRRPAVAAASAHPTSGAAQR